MLLNRTRGELEASMEGALFRVDEIPHVVESFLAAQNDLLCGLKPAVSREVQAKP